MTKTSLHGSGACWVIPSGPSDPLQDSAVATLAPEQFERLLALIGAGGQGVAGGGDRHRRKLLDTRGARVPEFDGKSSGFAEWCFAFRHAIRAMSSEAYELLCAAENRPVDALETGADVQEVQLSSELYDLLCQVCAGEAMAVLRSVDDCKGLYAWKKLLEKYRPKTMARQMKLLQEVLSPQKAKDGKEIEARYVQWRERVREERMTFGGLQLDEKAKIAIITSMMPAWIQEYVFMHAQEEWTADYTWEKIRAMNANKGDTGGPTPMDIGEVGAEQAEWVEVDAVSANTECYRCGGWGHMSGQCPSKGKGKGKSHEKGKGKGGPWQGPSKGGEKAGFKGKGKGQAGKGYLGSCWNCGKVGHKSRECGTSVAAAIEETEAGGGEEVDYRDVGGVWTTGSVEIKEAMRTNPEEDGQPGQKTPEEDGQPGQKTPEEDGQPGQKTMIKDEKASKKKTAVKIQNIFKALEDERISDYDEVKVEGELKQIVDICPADVRKRQKCKITVDSGAGLRVWPVAWKCGGKLVKERTNIRLGAANGTSIKTYGDFLSFRTDGAKEDCEMKFLITDVKNARSGVGDCGGWKHRRFRADETRELHPEREDGQQDVVGVREGHIHDGG